MPTPPLNARDPAHDKPGKRNVTYPYGDLRFPRIKVSWTRNKGEVANNARFLQPYRDQQSYPGCLLVAQDSNQGDDSVETVTNTYETLPGPILLEVDPYRDTGVGMIVSRQNVAATADYVTGEFQPQPIAVSSITDNGDGTCTVTLAGRHDLPPKCWVLFAGTNSTPSLDGNARIIQAIGTLPLGGPNYTQLTVAIPGGTLSDAGTAAGTMVAVNRIVRQLKPFPNNTSLLIKIDTMVAVASTTPLAVRNVLSVVNTTATTATVTLDAAHGLLAGQWVMFSGTVSTPPVDGPARILSVPGSDPATLVIERPVTANGGNGGTMVYMGDLANFNEDFKCWKDYDFPDFLEAIKFFKDLATTSGFTGNSHISWGGAVALPMQDGYRGPCRARRLRLFYVGPPPDSLETNLPLTFILPSSGTFVIEGGSKSQIFSDAGGPSISNSVSYRTGRIPHCLTGIAPAVITVGNGQATVQAELPESIPPRLLAGQVITMMGQPTKYDAGALWEVIVWFVEVPYTSGIAPDGFSYTENPAVYLVDTPIATNSPILLTGAGSSFAISPSLPSGLSMDSTTGDITGTTSLSTQANTLYKVTCQVGGVTQTASLYITIFE